MIKYALNIFLILMIASPEGRAGSDQQSNKKSGWFDSAKKKIALGVTSTAALVGLAALAYRKYKEDDKDEYPSNYQSPFDDINDQTNKQEGEEQSEDRDILTDDEDNLIDDDHIPTQKSDEKAVDFNGNQQNVQQPFKNEDDDQNQDTENQINNN